MQSQACPNRRVQTALRPASVARIRLPHVPGHGWQCCIGQPGDTMAVRAKDFNAGWQLREADPLEKPPIGTAVVVGAGVAGLVSALGLAKFGMQVHVCC
jgi:NAD(P)H-nitrite reductase large subunit